ncbi:MAG: replication protein [Stomatobaculum sp.]
MKPKKGKSFINLEQLAGGAFAEKLNEALLQVAENIQNPNTDAVAKRGITINLKFAPNKSRQIVNTTIAVTTKLAATEAIDTQMVMGLNLRTGELEIAEYDGQIRGQMNLADYAEDAEDEETEEELRPTGKPLDLRNRNRQQATPDLVPGRDYDPDTGEVYETTGQSADNQKATGSSIVTMFNKAAQA